MNNNTPTPKLRLSESFRRFLGNNYNASKICRVIYKIYDPCNSTDDYYRNHYNGKANYLTTRKNGLISFLPEGKELKFNEQGEWSREGRQECKPGRLISLIFSKPLQAIFSDIDRAQFSALFKATFDESSFVYEEGGSDLIIKAYQNRAIGSCMSASNFDAEKIEIYTENPDVVSIATLWNGDRSRLLSRALLWKIDGKTWADRIYTDGTDAAETIMRDKFIERGYNHKAYQNYSNKVEWVNPEGMQFNRILTVNLKTDFSKYPYLDTFTYGGDGYLTNDQEGEPYTYDNTNGTRTEIDPHEGEVYSDIEGEYIDASTAVWIEDRDTYCHCDDATYVEGRYYYSEDLEEVTLIQLPDGQECDPDELEEVDSVYIDGKERAAVRYNDTIYLDRDTTEIDYYRLPNGNLIER